MNIPKNILNILNTLKYNNFNAYIIGGAVRDYLLGVEPKDFDIVTNATPEQVCALFYGSTTCGNAFLVSLVDGVEVATYRKDREDYAEVAKTLYEDVSRRDFTINALAYDSGILDLVDGKKDLDNRILRFVGEPDKRIKEDPVRILRGLRFASQYNLEIEKEAYFAMYANRRLLQDIPGERIQIEVIKAFKHNNTYRFLTLLKELDMLFEVFPTLCCIESIEGGPNHDENVLQHCFNAVKAIDDIGQYKLKLACLYHDIGKHTYDTHEDGHITFYDHHKNGQDCIEHDLLEHLKFPKKTVDYVKFMARHHMDSLVSKKSIKRLCGRLSEYNIPLKDFIYLRYADKKGNMKHSVNINFKDMQAKYRECLNILKEKPPFSIKDLNVTGCNIMEHFDLTPGPEVGRMLSRALEVVLDETVENETSSIIKYLEVGE